MELINYVFGQIVGIASLPVLSPALADRVAGSKVHPLQQVSSVGWFVISIR